MSVKKAESVSVTVAVERETAKAWLMSDKQATGFVPMSQIRGVYGRLAEGETVTINLPRWLAEDKGFEIFPAVDG